MRDARGLGIRIGRWSAGVAGGVLFVLAALLWTPPGHGALAWIVARATHGEVVIRGLGGGLPNHVRAKTVELRDAGGVWLRASDISLDWSALAALGDHIAVRRLDARQIFLLRLPRREETSSGTTPRIDIAWLALPDITVGKAVAGHQATFAAQGSLHYVSRHQLGADIAVVRAASDDRYAVNGGIDADVAKGSATIMEGADGLLGKLIGLPRLGPVNLRAQATGGAGANRISLLLDAGPLHATGKGTLSLADRRADIDFSAASPAMKLRDDLGWQSLTLEGHVHGGFDSPDVRATFRMSDVESAGVRIAALEAAAAGRAGAVDLTATARRLRLPGELGDVFAAAPVVAKMHADLAAPSRPVRFSLSHPRAALEGTAQTRGTQSLSAVATIPSLAPFAAFQRAGLGGSARLKADARREGAKVVLSLDGTVKAQGGSMVARMLGSNAGLALHAVIAGKDIVESRIALQGSGLKADVDGSFVAGRLDYRVSLGLPNLARLSPALGGDAQLSGKVTGLPAQALVDVSGSADMASRGFARQRIAIKLRATGLPNPVSARLQANGKLDGAPLSFDASLNPSGPARNVKLTAGWRSLAVRAAFNLPQSGRIAGDASLELKNLADLTAFTGIPASGRLHAAIDFSPRAGHETANLHLRAAEFGLADTKIGVLAADGAIADPFSAPRGSLKIDATKISARGVTGDAVLRLNGPAAALGAELTARLQDPAGNAAHVAANAVIDLGKRRIVARELNADWRGQTIKLTQPATIDFASGIVLDNVTAAVAGGRIALSGRLAPVLALSASADTIDASTLALFMPQLSIDGSLSADAKVSGSLAAPQGTVTIRGRGLRARIYSAKSVASADLDARAVLHGSAATLDATLKAGKSGHFSLAGEVPLAAHGGLRLHAAGTADIAILNPILMAQGRQARGTLTMDGDIAGSIGMPRITGGANLADGEIQDFATGLRVRAIAAALKSDNGVVHIVSLSARAGPGTIAASGTVDTLAPGMPLDVVVTMHGARPIVSDQLTALLSGEVKLRGKLMGAMTLSGAVTVPRAELNLPDSFPPDVAVLDIRRRGLPPPPPPSRNGALALDVSVATTGPVTVRGHGIDADLGGNIRLSGASGAPDIAGGFEMRRGTFSIAGQTLEFTSGKVSFDGGGLRGRLDPTLDFTAREISGGVTATLTVGGYASAPKITLSSSPALPQDEVLAHLLFQQSAKKLSPLQLAEIAQALASLGGIGSGFSPLASLRGGLGLDRLSVGGGGGATAGTTVEAGKYVSHNVYVGARQGLSGGSQAQVQVDITKNLKAQATVSTGANATVTKGSAAQDTGSSIGLSYQFEY